MSGGALRVGINLYPFLKDANLERPATDAELIALSPISKTRSLSLTQIQLNLWRAIKVTIFTRTLLSCSHLNPSIVLLNRCQNNPFHSQNEQQRHKQIFPIHNSVLLSI